MNYIIHISTADFKIINHPVHIITEEEKTSPSAFIPFCEFGGHMLAVGVKIDQFDLPVCDSFQAKILNNQVCYEIDLNRYFDENSTDIESGFNFIMDYNEDRQITFNMLKANKRKRKGLVGEAKLTSDHDQQAFIYLETIGNVIFYNFLIFKTEHFQSQLS